MENPADEIAGVGRARGGETGPSGTLDRPLPYMAQLDGLRCVAVSLVCFGHWVPLRHQLGIPFGSLGVRTFFVLSGLLITEILLHARDRAAGGGDTAGRQIRIFYVRRALRIFPVFYALVLVVYVLGYPPMRETVAWHLVYLSNVCIALYGGAMGRIAHLWSLAAEEQFYLLWPWVVLFLPGRLLLRAVIVFAGLGPLARLTFWHSGWSDAAIPILPFSAFDSLGAGALLALARATSSPRSKQRIRRTLGRFALPAVLGSVSLRALTHAGWLAPEIALAHSIDAVWIGWVVWRAAEGAAWPVRRILAHPHVVYLGQISYGLYLFHNAASATYPWLEGRIPLIHLLPVRLAVFFAMTTAAAALSWECFERPIQRWKRRFPNAEASRAP